jgi:O-acetyl-ADP-ribose deacetylase (regulator of RNase III)
MLEYVTGSLFESPAQTLVNTVNVVGVMGKGIAADFKKRYPAMYQQYVAFCKSGKFHIGQLWIYRTDHKWILNFPTKGHWRQPSKLEYIDAGLRKFVDTYSEQGIASVSFPQLGCGNGGLDWNDVRPIMVKYLDRIPIPVFVHIAARPTEFVPEHLDLAARHENLRARRTISFQEFLSDLFIASGQEVSEARSLESMSEFPPPVILSIEGKQIEVPLEHLEDLWNGLRLRGALRLNELPGNLRGQQGVMDILVRLPYVRPMRFLGDSEAGIQFAPEASDSSPPAPIRVGRSR